jgi:hypothetical protein
MLYQLSYVREAANDTALWASAALESGRLSNNWLTSRRRTDRRIHPAPAA